jgi:ketosteroid isomerase-like protein
VDVTGSPVTSVQIVTELATRFAAGDGAGAMALFGPDIRIEQPPSFPHGGWHQGAAGMAEMGRRFAEHWDRTITDPRIFGEGDRVVQVTSQTWTSKATGRAATVDVVELFRVADGLIREIRVFQQDSHLLLATLAQ